MANYQPSTRQAIADMTNGLHVQTIHGNLGVPEFTSGAQTELFNVVGRIKLMQFYLQLDVLADGAATLVTFNCTFTTPGIIAVALNVATATIASLAAHGMIHWIGGAVGSVAVITAAPGIADVQPGANGNYFVIGGVVTAGTGTVATLGLLMGGASQAGTISATAHCHYVPMSPGAYVTAVAGV
jgi:hypothetical protein